MKKVFLFCLTLVAAMSVSAEGLNDEISASRDRSAKLQALCNGYKTCGNANIDGYGNSMRDAALFAIANSEQLEGMYKRQLGENKDGIQDVTVTKPTLDEWVALSVTVAGEGAKITEAVNMAQAAGEEAKKMAEDSSKEKNPMKAGKAAKQAKAAAAVVTFGNEATPILLDESAAQVKAINEIINTIKSGNNL